MSKYYECSYSKDFGYAFVGGEIKIVDLQSLKEVSYKTLGVSLEEIGLDASKSYMKHLVIKTPSKEKEVSVKPKQSDLSENNAEEMQAFKNQLSAKDFGDYLIVINDFKEKDFDIFTGSKQDLNEHLAQLNLHEAPKVYALKQLQVERKYLVK